MPKYPWRAVPQKIHAVTMPRTNVEKFDFLTPGLVPLSRHQNSVQNDGFHVHSSHNMDPICVKIDFLLGFRAVPCRAFSVGSVSCRAVSHKNPCRAVPGPSLNKMMIIISSIHFS